MRKVTYPHLGSLSVAMHGLLSDLGLEVIAPPPTTKKTINLGVLHSPEFACFPLKINMGNFIEALEAGADTIVMAGGTGPCRFGYYAQVQREILRDLGYEFEMIVLEPPQGHLRDLTDKVRTLCNGCSLPAVAAAVHTFWRKVKALDYLHAKSLSIRAREAEKGSASIAYDQGIKLLAAAKTPRETARHLREAVHLLDSVSQKADKNMLRIGLVGEIYMLLEPYANLHVEKVLGEMGVEVERSIYISHWIKEHVVLSSLGLPGSLATKSAGAPYLNHFVGGHGRESVGDMVRFARRGFDGVIHILPFTCTPEIVAQSVLPEVSRREGIPYLSVSLDEQSGEAGFLTRLEAFLDLLAQRRSRHRDIFAKFPQNAGI